MGIHAVTAPLRRDELELIQGLAEGLTFRQVGARYGLSEAAAKDRVRRIRRRFGAHTVAQLVAIVAGRGQLWL